MQAICRYCQAIVDSGPVPVTISLKKAPELGLKKIVSADQLRQVLEWHKLGEKLFEHLISDHPEQAGDALQMVTLCTAYLFSRHFTGGEAFDDMQELARQRALERFSEPAPSAIRPPDGAVPTPN